MNIEHVINEALKRRMEAEVQEAEHKARKAKAEADTAELMYKATFKQWEELEKLTEVKVPHKTGQGN